MTRSLDQFGRCFICGRTRNEPCNTRTHYVHDHLQDRERHIFDRKTGRFRNRLGQFVRQGDATA